ncbi:hypothetical protein AgCh_028708 [Apium graveolens]
MMCDTSDYVVGAVLKQRKNNEFELEIKDRNGTENQVADHLSRLEDLMPTSQDKSLINEYFPDEQLFGVQAEEPWFANIVNYLVEVKALPTNDAKNSIQDSIGNFTISVGYGKGCHLPVELEHKAYWALKKLNLDLDAAEKKRMLQLIELDKFRLQAYKNDKMYKEKVKRWHDRGLVLKSFGSGQQVLLFNSRLRLFPGKLKSRLSGPFVVKTVFPHGAVEIFDNYLGQAFKVNGQRLKYYYGDTTTREVKQSAPTEKAEAQRTRAEVARGRTTP